MNLLLIVINQGFFTQSIKLIMAYMVIKIIMIYIINLQVYMENVMLIMREVRELIGETITEVELF